jgi:3-phosphoglycerate kinase
MNLKTLNNIDLEGKDVLLRTGFDVPLKDGQIFDDRRIRSGLPTIEYCLSHGVSKITIISHLGRPGGKLVADLSNLPVKNKLFELVSNPKKIVYLENLRFFPGEEENNQDFAKKLAEGHDIFIQDAFNTLHESHASIVSIPKYLPSVAGLLVEKEIKVLSGLLDNVDQPYIVIIGGKKIETKVPVIEQMKNKAQFILVGGMVATEIQQKGLYKDENIILPVDTLKDETGADRDIGPKTIEIFKEKIASAKVIFWNGSMGKTEDSRFAKGSSEIATAICQSPAKTYVGGGDTTGIIDNLGLYRQFSFISTGGGASLTFLSGQDLVGLLPLLD